MNKFIFHIRRGNFKHLLSVLFKRIYCENHAYGFKRDLSIPFKDPEAKISIHIRELIPEDLDAFNDNLTNHGLFQQEIKTPYVAIDDHGTPCYYQWLMGPGYNKEIKRFWKGSFPELSANEALLENAFTTPNFRGLRIMPAAMSRIAKKALSLQLRYVITFVEVDNIPSLKGCRRAGFEPYILRTEKWLFFHKTVTYSPIPSILHNNFEKLFTI